MAKNPDTSPPPPAVRQLRLLGYAYIALLVLEGALRKWVAPALSEPLLLIRDPVVLLAYGVAFSHGIFPQNRYILIGGAIIGAGLVTTLFFGHGNPIVAAFGVKATFLHIPFAFLLGRVFDLSDVVRIGKWWLWGTIPMTAIIVLQFYSPQSAWINLSVGGVEGGGFAGALGRYRPPGTFSFIVGVIWFYTFTAAFLMAGLTQHNRYSKLLLGLAALSLLIAVPVSISRSLILAAGLTAAVGLFTATFRKNAFQRLGRLLVIALFAILAASQFGVFEDSVAAFAQRWENSTGQRGGFSEAILGRLLYTFYGPFSNLEEAPVFGLGLGYGTQVGARLLTGERGFTIAESEWFRMTGELGIFLGTAFILWRVAFGAKLGLLCLGALKNGNGVALILFSATAYNLLMGQLGQATIMGFTIMGIGLTIAAMRNPKRSPANSPAKSPTNTKASAAPPAAKDEQEPAQA